MQGGRAWPVSIESDTLLEIYFIEFECPLRELGIENIVIVRDEDVKALLEAYEKLKNGF